jgi:hypothetical protein
MDGFSLDFDGLADGGADSQRTRSRDSLFLTARMRLGDQVMAQDVRVRNLSEGGLMVEVAKPLPIGTLLTLEVRGLGEVRGSVAWYAEGRAGVALDRPIDPKRARKPVNPAAKR